MLANRGVTHFVNRYTDAPDENWVIGYHPEDTRLVLATAGSGHAYKVRTRTSLSIRRAPHYISSSQFLPVVGRLVADAIEGKLPSDVASRFAVNRPHAKDGAVAPELRYQPAEELVVDQLCGPDDLLPVPS